VEPALPPLTGGQGQVLGHRRVGDGHRLHHQVGGAGDGPAQGYQAAGIAQAAVAGARSSGPGLQEDALLAAGLADGPAVIEQGGQIDPARALALHGVGGGHEHPGQALDGHHVIAGGKQGQAQVQVVQEAVDDELVHVGGVVDQIDHAQALALVGLQSLQVGQLAAVGGDEGEPGVVMLKELATDGVDRPGRPAVGPHVITARDFLGRGADLGGGGGLPLGLQLGLSQFQAALDKGLLVRMTGGGIQGEAVQPGLPVGHLGQTAQEIDEVHPLGDLHETAPQDPARAVFSAALALLARLGHGKPLALRTC
jgi:hypothetical protein